MTNIATFNTVGVSTQYGKVKIRMANDIEWRQFMLRHEGHTDIQLVQLGRQMPKTEAVQLAMTHTTGDELTFGVAAQECFVKYLQDQKVIERPKQKRGRPAKVVPADAALEEPEAVAETPTEALVAAVTLTLEDIPRRDERGRLVSGDSRRARLAEMLAQMEVSH